MAGEELGWSSLLGMGLTAAAAVAVGLGIGWLADQLFDSSPIGMIVGLALGIVGAVCFTVVQFRTYLKTD